MLGAARVVPSLADALEGCGFVAATTARERDQYFRVMDVREAAARIVAEAQRRPAAVVFGAERTGLTNEELETAHVLMRIPASDAYASLNLAMAVQLVAYELFRARGARGRARARRRTAPLAAAQEISACTRTSRRCWRRSTFATAPRAARISWRRIRRFLQRAELDENEVNILRGILTAVQNRRRPRRRARGERTRRCISTTPPPRRWMRAWPRRWASVSRSQGRFRQCLLAARVRRGARPRASSRRAAQVAALHRRAAPTEIVFTSGATESNNLAILGCARANADRGRHMVTLRTEHKSVLDPCRRLEREGFSVT